jgi:hypothetical protein
MKAKLHLVIILGLLLLHPRYSQAKEPVQGSFPGHSFFREIQQEQSVVINDSQSPTSYFSSDVSDDVAADLDVDDDDDVSFSARKRISFEVAAYLFTTRYILQHFCSNAPGKYYSPHFYHFPPSPFISLRVFRL